jgi:carboxylesterase type B
MPAQVQHDGLSATFNGTQKAVDGVVIDQFLGIKYADIPARFERAQPVTGFGGAIVDASQFGYVVVRILALRAV